MWTPETRDQHDRDDLRYPSDLTDAEWQILAPLFPPPARTGRKRGWEMREVVNAIFFVLRGGCPWRMLPQHFPPHQTTYRWFTRFRDDGTWEGLNHELVKRDRERAGRQAAPSAAVIDTQSVKTTEAGGPRGYCAAKKVNGRKRHALVDTDGRSLEVQVHAASVQDRDGAPAVLQAAYARLPSIQTVFADSVYAGERVAKATAIAVEIVRKLPDQVGFQVLPRRWVVERFFAWINRNRRLAKDFEATIASAKAFLYAACVMLLTRRLARSG
ncbi:MAG TPA: IS5 family transposase [Acetobacteraceae bacterium]|nr:IS5 family transposase [Acetobacteraceae bacterium]